MRLFRIIFFKISSYFFSSNPTPPYTRYPPAVFYTILHRVFADRDNVR